MEKLTIEKAGLEKEVKTKNGLVKKQGVQFKEHPGVWHDIWASGLKVGDVLEGERVSREWEGKIYWNFNLPKKSTVELEKIKHDVEVLKTEIGRIKFHLNIKPTTPGNEEEKAKGYHYPTPEEEGINPDEITYPNDDNEIPW